MEEDKVFIETEEGMYDDDSFENFSKPNQTDCAVQSADIAEM